MPEIPESPPMLEGKVTLLVPVEKEEGKKEEQEGLEK